MTVSAAQTTANANATMEGQYGFVQDLVSTIPEIAALVKSASAQGASADAFEAMLENTNWWRTNADTARTMVALKDADPATYTQRLTQAQEHVQQLAAQMGITLTTAQAASYGTSDLFQGLDDATLKTQLGQNFSATGTQQATTGDAAALQQQLQAMSVDYGVPVTQTWMNKYINENLTTGQTAQETLAGAQQSLMNSAMTAYPSIAQQIAAGQTVKDIAQPYIAQMSQILEIPDTNISVTDPTIQKALSNPSLLTPGSSGSKPGTPTTGTVGIPPDPTTVTTSGSTSGTSATPGSSAMPLWQFQNQLRQDPRWQQTDNARSTAYSLLGNLGKSFGFST